MTFLMMFNEAKYIIEHRDMDMWILTNGEWRTPTRDCMHSTAGCKLARMGVNFVVFVSVVFCVLLCRWAFQTKYKIGRDSIYTCDGVRVRITLSLTRLVFFTLTFFEFQTLLVHSSYFGVFHSTPPPKLRFHLKSRSELWVFRIDFQRVPYLFPRW